MIKQILDSTEYTFDASTKMITFTKNIDQKHILLVTNITDSIIIYNPVCSDLGGSVSMNKLTLDYDTATMSDSDELQIIVYTEAGDFEANALEYLTQLTRQHKTLDHILQELQTHTELLKQMF